MSLRAQIKGLLGPSFLSGYRRLRYGAPPQVYDSCRPVGMGFARGAYSGRCFILGGAPSLNQMDLAPLTGEILMAVNRGYLLRERGISRVEFYGLSDVNAYREYAHLVPADFAAHTCVFGSIPWQHSVQGTLSAIPMYSAHNPAHFMSAGFFQFDLPQPVAHTYTVILQMVQVAVYAGFREIYVLGVDNDFSGPNMHFYKDTETEKRNMAVWGINPCPDNERAFAVAYAVLRDRGILLANAGVGGKLMALPRVDLSGLLSSKT